MFSRWLAGSVLALSFVAAQAQAVKIEQAWVRATVPQQKSTAAFMRLQAAQTGRTLRLVEASTPLAEQVEIHSMAMKGDVMTMRAVSELLLPAGQQVELSASGQHLMLLGLKKPLSAGESVPLTLVFAGPGGQRQSLTITAQVRPLSER